MNPNTDGYKGNSTFVKILCSSYIPIVLILFYFSLTLFEGVAFNYYSIISK